MHVFKQAKIKDDNQDTKKRDNMIALISELCMVLCMKGKW